MQERKRMKNKPRSLLIAVITGMFVLTVLVLSTILQSILRGGLDLSNIKYSGMTIHLFIVAAFVLGFIFAVSVVYLDKKRGDTEPPPINRTKLVFYSILTVFCLIAIPPAGVALLWSERVRWRQRVKILLTVVSACLLLAAAYAINEIYLPL
jgi:drug/metabolite transporter (DMT)-like permease